MRGVINSLPCNRIIGSKKTKTTTMKITENNHPSMSYARTRAAVGAAKTDALTPRGVLRAALKVGPISRWWIRTGITSALELNFSGGKPEHYQQPTITQDERDTRRAIADPVFRRAFTASLRREAKKLTSLPARTPKKISYHESDLPRKNARLEEIRSTLTRIGARKNPVLTAPLTGTLPNVALIPVTDPKKIGMSLNMRAKESRVIECFAASSSDEFSGHTDWKNGRAVKYHRATADHYVRSFAVISGPLLGYYINDTTGKLVAPEGYSWGKDAGGIKLHVAIDESIDYHPDAADLLRGMEKMVVKLQANAAKRAAQATASGIPLSDVWVSERDSLAGGNCLTGTREFAAKLGLNRTLHYPAILLVRKCPRDSRPRLDCAISAARKRQAEDMQRGFSDIAAR